jgi:hypothetical protein
VVLVEASFVVGSRAVGLLGEEEVEVTLTAEGEEEAEEDLFPDVGTLVGAVRVVTVGSQGTVYLMIERNPLKKIFTENRERI